MRFVAMRTDVHAANLQHLPRGIVQADHSVFRSLVLVIADSLVIQLVKLVAGDALAPHDGFA